MKFFSYICNCVALDTGMCDCSSFADFIHRIERLIGCPPETEEWLDNEAVCRRLGISKRTLQHYRDTGKIPFSMVGHKCYYKESDITEILNAKKD